MSSSREFGWEEPSALLHHQQQRTLHRQSQVDYERDRILQRVQSDMGVGIPSSVGYTGGGGGALYCNHREHSVPPAAAARLGGGADSPMAITNRMQPTIRPDLSQVRPPSSVRSDTAVQYQSAIQRLATSAFATQRQALIHNHSHQHIHPPIRMSSSSGSSNLSVPPCTANQPISICRRGW